MEVYAEMIPLRLVDSCEFPISHTGGERERQALHFAHGGSTDLTRRLLKNDRVTFIRELAVILDLQNDGIAVGVDCSSIHARISDQIIFNPVQTRLDLHNRTLDPRNGHVCFLTDSTRTFTSRSSGGSIRHRPLLRRRRRRSGTPIFAVRIRSRRG